MRYHRAKKVPDQAWNVDCVSLHYCESSVVHFCLKFPTQVFTQYLTVLRFVVKLTVKCLLCLFTACFKLLCAFYCNLFNTKDNCYRINSIWDWTANVSWWIKVQSHPQQTLILTRCFLKMRRLKEWLQFKSASCLFKYQPHGRRQSKNRYRQSPLTTRTKMRELRTVLQNHLGHILLHKKWVQHPT